MPVAFSFSTLRPEARRLAPGLLALALLAPLVAAAQPPRAAPPRPVLVAPLPAAATPAPALRPAAATHLRRLRADPALRYRDVAAEPASSNIFLQLLEWLLRLLGHVRGTPGGRVAWDVVFYGLLIGTLAFAVLKLLQVDLTGAFGRSARRGALGYEVGEENIHELDFEQAIAEAEAAGNRRLAGRLGYLQLLKLLADQALIDWQPDKTNQTYLRELAAARPPLRADFAELTRQFEYVWYGEWPLGAAAYERLRQAQRAFGQQVGRRQPA